MVTPKFCPQPQKCTPKQAHQNALKHPKRQPWNTPRCQKHPVTTQIITQKSPNAALEDRNASQNIIIKYPKILHHKYCHQNSPKKVTATVPKCPQMPQKMSLKCTKSATLKHNHDAPKCPKHPEMPPKPPKYPQMLS